MKDILPAKHIISLWKPMLDEHDEMLLFSYKWWLIFYWFIAVKSKNAYCVLQFISEKSVLVCNDTQANLQIYTAQPLNCISNERKPTNQTKPKKPQSPQFPRVRNLVVPWVLKEIYIFIERHKTWKLLKRSHFPDIL